MRNFRIAVAISILSLIPAIMMAKPIIAFSNTEYDFGQIKEDDGRVTAVFIVQNKGDEPLLITNCRSACGCATPQWERKPIAPHSAGEVKVTYNPQGRPGAFRKSIQVYSNATNEPIDLYIQGEVLTNTKRVESAAGYATATNILDNKANDIFVSVTGIGSTKEQAQTTAYTEAIKLINQLYNSAYGCDNCTGRDTFSSNSFYTSGNWKVVNGNYYYELQLHVKNYIFEYYTQQHR